MNKIFKKYFIQNSRIMNKILEFLANTIVLYNNLLSFYVVKFLA